MRLSDRGSRPVLDAVDHADGRPTPLGRDISVGVVHDWLPVYAGAERVLEQILEVVPQADIYSLIDFLPDEQRAFLGRRAVETSFIQKLPFARTKYRYYLPFTPIAIEQFDLGAHDVVVSSSYASAKGVLTKAEQLHISYVHSPVRYAWDLHFDYLREGNVKGLRGLLARLVLHYMRLFDVASASRPDVYVANSQTVARRIWKTYRRRARVVYPPVDTERFTLQADKQSFYLTMSRLVPYKRVDLIVEAFNAMPDKELIVIGDGPESDRLRKMAGPNVSMLGYQPDEAVLHYMQQARGFIYAAEEDFGIVPVEAQACGTPVIAYGRGGATETVRPGETGLFFDEQSVPSLVAAVEAFERQAGAFDPHRIRAHAEQFSKERFRAEFDAHVAACWASFEREGRVPEPAPAMIMS